MFEKTMDTKPLSPSQTDPAVLPLESPEMCAAHPELPTAVTPEQVPPTADSAGSSNPGPASPRLVPRARRENPFRELFLGPNGLYPGTRWLIYLGVAWLIFIVLEWLTQQFRASNTVTIPGEMSWEICLMSAAILPAFLMARIEQRSLGDFGLPRRRAFGRNFWMGTLWGIGSLTVLMLSLYLTGAFEFGALELHGSRILKYGFYYAVIFLMTGFAEEFLFRGYSQWVLSRGMNFWPAAALLSVGFGAIHSGNSGEAKTGLVAAGLIGFFFCLTLRRTGSLWWAIGFHMSWDWGESFLYSVPDSGGVSPGHLLRSSFHGPTWLTGGSVGPEGSALIFVLLVALWMAFNRAYPEVKYEAG